MKKVSSAKKMCDKCKITWRKKTKKGTNNCKRVLVVNCVDPKHKQTQ